ncbi:unnamed protein product [Pleuronectes platessa]|uniref:Uncharacterized protein n=1 Tax=Pleuronectes platessa TaxID=8262 RepID=A0A9N7U960_PLEPL|nr:unnamed protein product [Pleuronectes platessa]
MPSKAHWPVFMREPENVDLNAELVGQPLSLAILLPLLSFPFCSSPPPTRCSAVGLYSRTLLAAVYHVSGIPAWLPSSSAPCIPSSCSVGSFKEGVRTRLQP